MGRTSQNLEINNFSGGLNTEASPLSYPPNSSLDEQNMVLHKDGSRSRRNGLKREETLLGPEMLSTELSNYFLKSIKVDDKSYIQLGKEGAKLIAKREEAGSWFFNYPLLDDNRLGGIYDDTGEWNNSIAFTSDTYYTSVSDFTLDGYIASTIDIGSLLPVNNAGLIKPQVRDVWGSLDTEASNNESSRWIDVALNPQLPYISNQRYNLLNGTWPAWWSWRDSIDTAAVVQNAPYSSVSYLMPALSDNFWLYTSDVTVTASVNNTGSFVHDLYQNQAYFKDLSPIRGKLIIDPFNRGFSRVTQCNKLIYDTPGTGVVPDNSVEWMLPEFNDISTGNFNCITSHLGRVWMTTRSTLTDRITSSPDLDSLVFFSKVINKPLDVAKLHSDQSPTSQDYEGDVATDGGFVNIEGMTRCTALVPLQRSMIVFGENGIWQIDGGEENFSASSLQVIKLSEIGTSLHKSIVTTGDSIYYWADGGIYQIVKDDISLKGVENNISYNTVNRVVQEIVNPESVSGVFDRVSLQCRWLFCEKDIVVEDRQCSSELVLDTVTGSFSLNRFPVGIEYPNLVGYVETLPYKTSDSDRRTGTALVAVRPSGDDCYIDFYTFTNEEFVDYDHISGGVDAKAYMLGGYITAGDSQRKKQMGYLTCSFKRTEDGFTGSDEIGWDALHPSSCFMQTQWGWTSSATTGKWGRVQQVYRMPRLYVPEDPATDDWSNFGYDVINSRTKIRGMGKAVSLLFQSEEGKDLHLYGWGATASIANTV